MSRNYRSTDFTAEKAKLRKKNGTKGNWRTLFRVRRSDYIRMLRSMPITLPVLASVSVLVLSIVFTQANHRAVVAEMEAEASRYAAALEQGLQAVLARVVEAAAQPDIDSERLRALLPESDTARLVPLGPLGIADKDNPALDDLRHIERDMLRRALDFNEPVLDAYRDAEPDSKRQWVISAAYPASDIGAVLVTYPADYLRSALAAAAGSAPLLIEVLFNINGNWHSIAQRGGVEASPASGRSLLQRPLWAVRATLGQTAYQQRVHRNLWLYVTAVLGGVAALIQAALALNQLSLRRRARMSQAEWEAYQRAQSEEQWQESLMQAAFEGNGKPERAADADAAAAPPAAPEPPPEDDYLDVRPIAGAAKPEPAAPAPEGGEFPAAIFRAYDIRGRADTQLTSTLCRDIGLALGSELRAARQTRILVARDGRNSSPRIRDALVEGLRTSGVDVTDLGAVPTPVMHFATHELGVGNGAMITGSHNSRDYNGIKMVVAGQSLTGDAVEGIKRRIQERDFSSGQGSYDNRAVVDDYIERVRGDIVVGRRLRVVIDAGNGVAGPLAPRLFQALGCMVEPLFCELDGDFPNHDPDPTRNGNLNALKAAVRTKRADLGIAFDGDGDRVVFVTAQGEDVYPDQILMLLARDVISRNPGARVVFDVKCSRHLQAIIRDAGGVPVMCRSGHSYVKNEVASTGAELGGEFTGHIFFRERWYGFDDGLYVAARLVELLSLGAKPLHEHLSELPESVSTPELLIETSDTQKFIIIDQLRAGDYFSDAEVINLDGIRAEYPGGWGLVRASNTVPALTLRFEADTREELEAIQAKFREALANVDPTLSLGF